MKRWMPALLLIGACSAQESGHDASEASMDSSPGVNVTAAPGVAFDYRYAFRLPAARIAAAQEAHAQACEKLGVQRCRVTGMRYRLDRDNDIDAMLALKLEPALARRFGQAGIATVERVGGMLVDAEITGVDAGAAIAGSEAQRTTLTAEIARIDAELARGSPRAAERADLVRRRAELTDAARTAQTSATEQRELLAQTPVTFGYESGRVIRPFDTSSPLARAADRAIASLQTTLAVLLWIVATLGPPALVLGLLWLTWLRVRNKLPRWRSHRDLPPA